MLSQLTYKNTNFSSQNWPKNAFVFCPASSGKEKDAETGYLYFGARYYNSDLSLWLSVDPMSDKYPSQSPYNYCALNPLKIVDPNGAEMDEWKIDLRGNIVERKVNNEYDIVSIVDDNGSILSTGCQFDNGTISELNLSDKDLVFDVCGYENAQDLFEYFADFFTIDNGNPLEWGHAVSDADNMEKNLVGTSHKKKSISLLSDLTVLGFDISEYTHNHPSGGLFASSGDVENASLHEKKHPGIMLYTYSYKVGYNRYNSMGVVDEKTLTNKWYALPWQEKNK